MPRTQSTTFTKHDAEEAYMIQVTVEALRAYFSGQELNEIIPELDDIIDEAQGAVSIANERRFIMIEVIP